MFLSDLFYINFYVSLYHLDNNKHALLHGYSHATYEDFFNEIVNLSKKNF